MKTHISLHVNTILPELFTVCKQAFTVCMQTVHVKHVDPDEKDPIFSSEY